MPTSQHHERQEGPSLVWFRNDLRITDNAALLAASECSAGVICLYILDDHADETTAYGAAQKWWLHHSLKSLAKSIEDLGGILIFRRGNPDDILPDLIDQHEVSKVYWNRRYATEHIKRDTNLKATLTEKGVDVKSFDGALLHEPTRVRTGSGGPYRVYTPFWRALSGSDEPRDPSPAPEKLKPFDGITSESVDDWSLLPTNPDWSGGIAEEWTPGETGAQKRLIDFLDGPIKDYNDGRDFPGQHNTSKLSPHLTFGEISPFQIWAETNKQHPTMFQGKETFRKEIVWREFSYHLLVNFEDLKSKNYNADFDNFPWLKNADHLKAWQYGKTGYPIVDAGMRQLYQTGWMHNRVRMIVGSFLVKHLLIDWREGEQWFWDTLVDADPASNTASWQWIAGSGADAAPYFRVFNPIIQGEKFDKDGAYVRQFCPELKLLDSKYLHEPWEAPKHILDRADVRLGETYPCPIVDHKTARDRALDAYKSMKDAKEEAA